MNTEDKKNVIDDCVAYLRSNNPKLCYEFINQFSDSSKYSKDKEELKSELFNRVLTARRDGTTERLNAIVHGVYLSELTGWPFFFSWVTNTGSYTNNLLSLDNFLPTFFNKKFVSNHYVEFEAFKEQYAITGGETTMCEYITGTEFKKKPNENDLRNALNVISPSIISPKISTSLDHVTAQVISEEYYTYQRDLKKELSGCIGLHYRGGDVIYGINRHGKHAIGDKSVPLSVLEKYINDNINENFVLFGTPVGETKEDMDYITKKFGNVTLAEHYRKEELDHVLQDCFLMATCRKIVSMSGTGVTRFASLINYNLDKRFFNDLYQGEELYSLLLNGVENEKYNKLQRAYHAVRALSFKHQKDEARLLALIKELDPENRLTWYS